MGHRFQKIPIVPMRLNNPKGLESQLVPKLEFGCARDCCPGTVPAIFVPVSSVPRESVPSLRIKVSLPRLQLYGDHFYFNLKILTARRAHCEKFEDFRDFKELLFQNLRKHTGNIRFRSMLILILFLNSWRKYLVCIFQAAARPENRSRSKYICLVF